MWDMIPTWLPLMFDIMTCKRSVGITRLASRR